MPITAALVANGEGESTADATSYPTASVSPTSNNLLLLAVANGADTPNVQTPTVSGLGLTWVQVASSVSIASTHRISLFRALGTVTPGVITLTYGAIQTNCCWRLMQFSGIDTGGTNGSAAIVQTGTAGPTGGTTTLSVDLTNPVAAGNATYSSIFHNSTSNALTPEPGFTDVGNQNSTNPGAPSIRLATGYSLTGTDPVAWAKGSGTTGCMIACEIKAAARPVFWGANVGGEFLGTSAVNYGAGTI